MTKQCEGSKRSRASKPTSGGGDPLQGKKESGTRRIRRGSLGRRGGWAGGHSRIQSHRSWQTEDGGGGSVCAGTVVCLCPQRVLCLLGPGVRSGSGGVIAGLQQGVIAPRSRPWHATPWLCVGSKWEEPPPGDRLGRLICVRSEVTRIQRRRKTLSKY